MIRKFLFLFALSAALHTSDAAIDLTPTPEQYIAEGITFRQLIFQDGKRRIKYEPPEQWTWRGDASRLQFTPPNQNFAEGVVQAASPLRNARFDEAIVKMLEAQVMSTVPQGSHGVTLVSQQQNPVVLNQNLSYEFVVSYQTLGQTFYRSVIFVNCPETQLVFRFTAPKLAFGSLNTAFRRSLYSWQWIDPSPARSSAMAASK